MRPPLSRKAATNDDDGSPLWEAYIAHSCQSRTRLSIPDLKGRPLELTALCDKTMKLKGVRQVDGRPLTGSLVVSHDGPPEDVARAARKAGIFDVKDAAKAANEHEVHADARAWKETIDRTLKEAVGHGLDARALGALAFFTIALRQVAAGHVMPPAATALWYGLNLIAQSTKTDVPPGGNGFV